MERLRRDVRMNGEMTVKKLLEMKTRRGRRKRERKGRPGLKLDWFSRFGLEECGCKEVQTGAVDRTEWENVVRGDKAKEEEKETLPINLLIVLLFFPRNW
jgi:hypothetical protein